MKKIMSMIVSIIITTLTSACGKDNKQSKNNPSPSSVQTQDQSKADAGQDNTKQDIPLWKQKDSKYPVESSPSQKEGYLTYVLGKFIHDGHEIVYA